MIWLLTCKLWQVVKVPKTQTHTRTTHACTHAHTKGKGEKAKCLAAAKRSYQPSRALLRHYEPVLTNPPGGELCRWGCTISHGDGVGTQSPTQTTPISRHGQQLDI